MLNKRIFLLSSLAAFVFPLIGLSSAPAASPPPTAPSGPNGFACTSCQGVECECRFCGGLGQPERQAI